MTDQFIPYDGSFEYSLDDVTYTSIPEVKGFVLPSVTSDFVDVTNLDSPGRFREYNRGMKDAGEVSFVMGYTPAGFNVLETIGDSLVWLQATLPMAPSQSVSGDVFKYQGYLTPQIDASDIASALDITVNVRISGDYTRTEGS